MKGATSGFTNSSSTTTSRLRTTRSCWSNGKTQPTLWMTNTRRRWISASFRSKSRTPRWFSTTTTKPRRSTEDWCSSRPTLRRWPPESYISWLCSPPLKTADNAFGQSLPCKWPTCWSLWTWLCLPMSSISWWKRTN